MKMKHSRAEIVKTTVCSYLKRRQYTDSEVFLKSDLQLCQTKQQLAVLSAVNKEAANKNSITFSSFVFDYSVVDLHFSRLKSWISRLSGPVQRELSDFLPPLLCHLAIDLLRWNVVLESSPVTISSAIKFLKKHASSLVIHNTLTGNGDGAFDFCSVEDKGIEHDRSFKEGHWRVMEEMCNLENCWDICKSKSLLLFRSCKYRVNLSSEALVLLQRYLADHAHICLIQTIGTWFDVAEVSSHGQWVSEVAEDDEEEDDEEEIMVQLWNDEGKEEDEGGNYKSEETVHIKGVSVAVNGCKEDCTPSLSDQVGIPPNDSNQSRHTGGASLPAQEMSDQSREQREGEGGEQEEEGQLRLLEAAIRSVREGPSSLNPLLLYSLENGDNNIICANVSQNGDMLAAGFGTSEVKVWGLTEGGLPPEVKDIAGSSLLHNKDKRPVARLACDIGDFDGDSYGNIVEEEEEDWTDAPMVLRGHSGTVHDVTISGHLLFSCSSDTTLRAWNITDHTCAAIYRGHSYPIWCVDVCTWGLYMATGSQDRTARLWSPERAFPLRTYAGHGLDVDCIRFHPNGLYLATGSCDHSVRLWSVSEGKLVRVFPHPSRGRVSLSTSDRHSVSSRSTSISFSPSVTALAFSPDGKFLASGAEDQRVRIWDLAAGSVVNELSACSLISSPESSHISDEASSNTEVHHLGIHGSVSGLCWSSGGERLACAFNDGTVAVWEVKRGISRGSSGWEGNHHVNQPSSSSFAPSSRSNTSSLNNHPSPEDGQPRMNLDGTLDHSALGFSFYSTGMQSLSAISYIKQDMLVCVGSNPPRYVT